MNSKIVVTDKKHLEILIKNEIESNGNKCDLNHLDISKVKDMSYLFSRSQFNGDISKWDVSNVADMSYLFYSSQFNGDVSKWNVSNVIHMNGLFSNFNFNGDISKWDVSNVIHMSELFAESEFNGDISKWDVSSVTDMSELFYRSKFNGDISNWKPISLERQIDNFRDCPAHIPYWAGIEGNKNIRKAIDSYELNEKLETALVQIKSLKKMKL